MINDAEARTQALNIQHSYLVQAPAGSGKTELLIQRYLALLTTVDKPEEIIAITFTRKAANEMRIRLINALNQAQQEKPEDNHKQKTWDLARAVLDRDQTLNWQLQANASRLRIQTIDALCGYLTKQMPLLTNSVAGMKVSSQSGFYYQQAASQFIASLEEQQTWSPLLAKLLLHLDNNVLMLEHLLVSLFASRDQWLPLLNTHASNQDLRDYFEKLLEDINLTIINNINHHFPDEFNNDLLSLMYYAQIYNQHFSPGDDWQSRDFWLAISQWLLTSNFSWRKSMTIKQGFPAISYFENAQEKQTAKTYKEKIKNLLASLSEYEDLRLALQAIQQAPAAQFADNQWEILECLLTLLPIAASYLLLVFKQYGEVDFIEISQNAINALTNHDAPTDLTLYLDYKIKHILLDEFQDTSITQFNLLQSLTSGWEVDDGRTLFLVGDPMQSIYRFRQADVSLFLHAKQHGINQIKLNFLQLSNNFRSQAPIVDWINHTFKQALPAQDLLDKGAISYHASIATKSNNLSSAVKLIKVDNGLVEALAIAKIIAQHPQESIAILVRSRSHLQVLLPYLTALNINYNAIEIESMLNQKIIIDLLHLTRALLNLNDRIAWLAILRAPWCGLTLNDLAVLLTNKKAKCLLEIIIDKNNYKSLSDNGQQRLSLFSQLIISFIQNRQRQSLTTLVEGAWRELSGPDCLQHEVELNYAKQFFELLTEFETQDGLDINAFSKLLTKRFVTQENPEKTMINVMSIHKSKGLEFDVVILPSLQSKTQSNSQQLLLWQSQLFNNNPEFLLAPIKQSQADQDSIYKYLAQCESEKIHYETGRLFYVAATRAKDYLYGFVQQPELDEDKAFKPQRSSLLAHIWQTAEAELIELNDTDNVNMTQKPEPVLSRLTQLKPPENPHYFPPSTNISNPDTVWQSETQRLVGTLTHQILFELGQLFKTDSNFNLDDKNWLALLKQAGISHSEYADAQAIIQKVIHNIVNHEQGRWILQPHPVSHFEYPLTGLDKHNQPQHFIIDRFFIDDENVGWIVDYKITEPNASQTQAEFIQEQSSLYQTQLNQYQALIQQRYPDLKVINKTLYFPLIQTLSLV